MMTIESKPYQPKRLLAADHSVDQMRNMHDLIVLYQAKDMRQVKKFCLSNDGSIETIPYNSAYKARPLVYQISGIEEVYKFLIWAEDKKTAVILRGLPLRPDRYCRRIMHSRPGVAPRFEDTQRSWLCIDIDNLPIPAGLSYNCPLDLAEYAVSKLPSIFHHTSFVWQLSSSARVKSESLIKLHLWFWLDTALYFADLKNWARLHDRLIDGALYQAVQPHISARPIFQGLSDPFKIRTSLVRRESDVLKDSLSLKVEKPPDKRRPPPANPKASRHMKPLAKAGASQEISLNVYFSGWPRIIQEMQDRQNFHTPIWKLILSYISRGGDNTSELIQNIKFYVRKSNTSGRTDLEEDYLTQQYLLKQIENAHQYLKIVKKEN